jgi:hypothetical protein
MSHRGLAISYVGTVAVLATFEIAALGVASVLAHAFADSRSLHALTNTSPPAIYLSLAISAATLVGQAAVLQGLVELPVGSYRAVAHRA